MSTIPSLAESQIEGRVGRRSFRRGRDYCQGGAIFNARRQGSTLKGYCTGSSVTAYRVEVRFAGHEVVEAECTCPVGRGGFCKHVAALLLFWKEHPAEFTVTEDLQTALARCSRRELIEIVRDLVDVYPDMEHLVEAKLPSSVPRMPADPRTYRHQVAALLSRAGNSEALDTGRLAEQLGAIREIGDAFTRQGEFVAAAVVYLAVVCELLSQAVVLAERQPPVAEVLDQCLEALGRCLAEIHDEEDETRTVILRTLLNLYRFDLAALGSARSDVPELLLAHATAGERRRLAEWIESMLPGADSRATSRALGGLWLALDSDRVDGETFARICRQSGRVFELAWRLIGSGQVELAVEEAGAADDYDLLRLADLLVAHGHGEAAEALVEACAGNTRERSLEQWLKRRRDAVRDRHAALELSERIFRLQPDFATYGRLRALARQLGVWDALHPQLLLFLEQAGRIPLLVRIHLDENDVDRAVGLVTSRGAEAAGWSLGLEVARAAQRSRPADALRLYRNHVEHLIAARGRDNYAEAAQLLAKIRTLMKRTGAARNWNNYLDDLRQRHRPLRALQEELDTAKLQ